MNKKVLFYTGLVALFSTTTGCVTAIPLTSQETCSHENMMANGVNIGTEQGGAVATSYGQNNVYISSNSSSRQVVCKPAQSEPEQCNIKAAQKSVASKSEFNSSVGLKRFLVGTGYVFYVLPGLVANWFYEGQKSDAVLASEKVYRSELTACPAAPVRLPTANND